MIERLLAAQRWRWLSVLLAAASSAFTCFLQRTPEEINRLCPLEPEESVVVEDLTITAVPVAHTVPTFGYLVDDGACAVAFGADRPPGLQGTEMWLAIVYLAADLLGESDGLSWRPRGVHRLAPADRLVASDPP